MKQFSISHCNSDTTKKKNLYSPKLYSAARIPKGLGPPPSQSHQGPHFISVLNTYRSDRIINKES